MLTRRLMTAGVAAAILALVGGTAGAGWWDKADDATPVDLTEVLRSPDGYRGKEITFDCTFHGVSAFYNPYYTRFVPSEYVNFSAWPAARKLWRETDYLESFSFLFLERNHKKYEQLMGMQKYTRLRLTGFVQNTFKSVPWIEVRHVEVLEGALTGETIREIVRGDEAAKAGRMSEALAHWDAAASRDLPPDVIASVDVKRGQAYTDLGRNEDARAALARALEADPTNPEALDLMARMESKAVEARPVDPRRYEPAPMAMPVPTKKPDVPAKVTPAEARGPEAAPEPPMIVIPATPAPLPEVQASPEATAPVVPETRPELPAEEPLKEPVKEPVPEKRMSGPM